MANGYIVRQTVHSTSGMMYVQKVGRKYVYLGYLEETPQIMWHRFEVMDSNLSKRFDLEKPMLSRDGSEYYFASKRDLQNYQQYVELRDWWRKRYMDDFTRTELLGIKKVLEGY